MKTPSARELPLVKLRIAALLENSEANHCTLGEAAFARAEELVVRHEIDPDSFRWPPSPSTSSGSATLGPSIP